MEGSSSQTPLDSRRIEGRGGEAEQSGGRLIIGDGGEKITFVYHFHWVQINLFFFPFPCGVICFRFHKTLGAVSVSSSCGLLHRTLLASFLFFVWFRTQTKNRAGQDFYFWRLNQC